MPGLVPGTHALLAALKKDVGGRDEPGHDSLRDDPRIKSGDGHNSLRDNPGHDSLRDKPGQRPERPRATPARFVL